MEQHHHPSSIRDGIVQTHLLATALIILKIADCVEYEILLILGKNHLASQDKVSRDPNRESPSYLFKFCLREVKMRSFDNF